MRKITGKNIEEAAKMFAGPYREAAPGMVNAFRNAYRGGEALIP